MRESELKKEKKKEKKKKKRGDESDWREREELKDKVSAILHLGWYCSTIVNFFAIVRFLM